MTVCIQLCIFHRETTINDVDLTVFIHIISTVVNAVLGNNGVLEVQRGIL
jgi:hypothetical protein